LVELLSFLHFFYFNVLFCEHVELGQWIQCSSSPADGRGDVTVLLMHGDCLAESSIWSDLDINMQAGTSVNAAESISAVWLFFSIFPPCMMTSSIF
jgi:hypothetical protein